MQIRSMISLVLPDSRGRSRGKTENPAFGARRFETNYPLFADLECSTMEMEIPRIRWKAMGWKI